MTFAAGRSTNNNDNGLRAKSAFQIGGFITRAEQRLSAKPRHSVAAALYAFSSADGPYPYGGVISDASGNLYGTTEGGRANGDGIAWEIAP